jgi:transposase
MVCDNLKAGVTATCRCEPGINRTYQEMAAHYGSAIVPTRVRKPRDKANVEVAAQVVERWVLASLRHRQFFSLTELNGVIRELIEHLNDRPMRRTGYPPARPVRFS